MKTPLDLLKKIVNTANGDTHAWTLKTETVADQQEDRLYKRPAKFKTFTLRVRQGRSVAVCIQRRLSVEDSARIAEHNHGDVFNELAVQAIVMLGCKGINSITNPAP